MQGVFEKWKSSLIRINFWHLKGYCILVFCFTLQYNYFATYEQLYSTSFHVYIDCIHNCLILYIDSLNFMKLSLEILLRISPWYSFTSYSYKKASISPVSLLWHQSHHLREFVIGPNNFQMKLLFHILDEKMARKLTSLNEKREREISSLFVLRK